MGHAREQTERLAAKLKQIREDLNLSQGGIIKLLGLEDKLNREDISKFERGVREPPLSVIVKYARAINVSTDILIDDELDLPEPED
jgi:transcriptional regulator with XRE-family HTH domain